MGYLQEWLSRANDSSSFASFLCDDDKLKSGGRALALAEASRVTAMAQIWILYFFATQNNL